MKRIALLTASLSLAASSAFAGLPYWSVCYPRGCLLNTASSGDATPAVVQTVALADGTLLTVH